MTTIISATRAVHPPFDREGFDKAQLAAASFLARYSGRTLEAYRHDLRGFFQRAADNGLDVLSATRPHIELFRAWMEQRGLAASTIDRRLSTVCGFYRFAHIDGRIIEPRPVRAPSPGPPFRLEGSIEATTVIPVSNGPSPTFASRAGSLVTRSTTAATPVTCGSPRRPYTSERHCSRQTASSRTPQG